MRARLSAAAEELVRDLFGRWVGARSTACRFAVWAIQSKSYPIIVSEEIDDTIGNVLSAGLQVAAERDELALIVLPYVQDEDGLATLLLRLRAHPRWSMTAIPDGLGITVDLRWKKPDLPESSIAGFAPTTTMPLTRRSPFVAIVAWPKGYDNPNRKRPGAYVGIGDMGHSLKKSTYDEYFKETRETVAKYQALPGGEYAKTGVSFRLPPSFQKRLCC